MLPARKSDRTDATPARGIIKSDAFRQVDAIPLLPEIHDLEGDGRDQRAPWHDLVVRKGVAHPAEPVKAPLFGFERSELLRLDRHISDLEVLQTPDFRTVLSNMRPSPPSGSLAELRVAIGAVQYRDAGSRVTW